jgi:hypothetical protein
MTAWAEASSERRPRQPVPHNSRGLKGRNHSVRGFAAWFISFLGRGHSANAPLPLGSNIYSLVRQFDPRSCELIRVGWASLRWRPSRLAAIFTKVSGLAGRATITWAAARLRGMAAEVPPAHLAICRQGQNSRAQLIWELWTATLSQGNWRIYGHITGTSTGKHLPCGPRDPGTVFSLRLSLPVCELPSGIRLLSLTVY